MRKLLIVSVVFGALSLSGCGKASASCSDTEAKLALEKAIRKNLEKTSIENVNQDGSRSISNSSIRASIDNIKLFIEDIRTTKEDPDSTKRFCTGTLKMVFSPQVFDDADRARELAGLNNIREMADSMSIEKGADYLKGDIDYSVQPTDDGSMVFAEFDDSDSKMAVFGEVVAASLLKSAIETQYKNSQDQQAAAELEQKSALLEERSANLEQANVNRKNADQAIMVTWKALGSNFRQKILPQQRAWIKQKDASCKVRGLQASNDPTEQKVAEMDCQAETTYDRIRQLEPYISDAESYEEGETEAQAAGLSE